MKHSIENGLLRYFEMEYMDESKLTTYVSSSKAPKLIVLLKGRYFKQDEYESLLKKASKQDVFVEVDATKYLMPMIEKFWPTTTYLTSLIKIIPIGWVEEKWC